MAYQTMSLGSVTQTVPGGLTGLSGMNLSDHSTLAPLDLGFSILFLVLIPIFVGLRIYVRFFVVRKVGLDDALSIAAAAVALPYYALIIFGVSEGLGRHIWDLIDFSNIMSIVPRVKRVVLVLWINNHLYSTALMLVKCSIAACYLRVFPGQVLFQRVIWAATGVILALWIASIFVGVFQCIPPSAAWDVTFRGAHCFPIVDFYYPANSVNIVTDLVLCIAPLPILWKLRVSRLERIVVIILFCFGFFATAASIARLVTLTQYILGGVDFTRYTSPTLIWSGVEIGVGIICATVPALRPILRRIIPRGSRSFSFSWKLSWISSKTRTSATSRTAYSGKGFEMLNHKSTDASGHAGGNHAPAPPPPTITVSRFSTELQDLALGEDVAPEPKTKTPEPEKRTSLVRPPGAPQGGRVPSFSRPLNAPDVQWRPPPQWDVEQAPEHSGPLLYPLAPRLQEPQTRLASRTSFYDSASESLGLKDEIAPTKSAQMGEPSDASKEKKDENHLTRIYEGSSSSGETFVIER